MAQTKRAWKLQEFVAHGANVNCLAMGHKTGRVMATGGEDRKVNLWYAGKPNCIMSLAGHTTPVEAVRFGHNEEMVVAGSMSGALKIWDLEEAKIMRTLTGHKSSIRTLDFHPYGDYAASGSLDCNVKLWDIRRKGCIYTYKGHMNAVNSLKFSPDGKWIISAGEDGLIKMWDLTAGKLMTDMKLHTAGVNVVDFHPNELLLASGSADKTVKFWDLETFQMVSSTEVDASPVRCIYFNPDGSCLYSGVKDYLKVYGWEPAQCFDSVPLAWGDVADITSAHGQLIAASFSKTNVSTFVVDLSKVSPHGGIPHQEGGQKEVSPPLTSSHGSRKNYLTDRPATQSSRQASVPKEDVSEPPSSTSPDQEDAESVADIKDPSDYQEIFQPRKRLDRSPSRQVQPFQPPKEDAPMPEPEPVKQPAPVKKSSSVSKTHKPAKRELPQPKQPDPSPQADPSRVSKQTVAIKPIPRTPTPPAVDADDFLPPDPSPSADPSRVSKQTVAIKPIPRTPTPPAVDADDFLPPDPSPAADSSRVSKQTVAIKPIPRTLTPPAVDADDFLPASARTPSNDGDKATLSEDAILDVMTKGHNTMLTILSNRSKNLQTVRVMWTSGNTKTAIDSAISMNDQSVIVDVLNVLNAKSGLWNLDISSGLLPHLKDLIANKYEEYVMTACDSLKIVLKNFGPVIKANIAAPPGYGVDISREERQRKCNACYKHLMEIRTIVEKKTTVPGKVGDTYRQLIILLGTLD